MKSNIDLQFILLQEKHLRKFLKHAGDSEIDNNSVIIII